MKKLVLTVSLLAGATAAYAQGTVNWTDYIPTTKSGPGFEVTIFGSPTLPPTSQGNTSGDLPSGNATYAGYTPLAGSAFEVGLYASTSALSPVTTGTLIATSTFLTGGSAGAWSFASGLVATDASEPTGTGVFLQLAAWSASAGSSYGAAILTPGAETGISDVSSIVSLGGPGSPPVTPPNLQGLGLQDFAIGTVPEPSTVALGVVGASAFLMRLRRKQ